MNKTTVNHFPASRSWLDASRANKVASTMQPLRISSPADVEQHLTRIEKAASVAVDAISKSIAGAASPLDVLRKIKFEQHGIHPVEHGCSVNLIEQINQTFTFIVALKAARWLLEQHPEAGGFQLAPGAEMALPFDIESVKSGFVCAETFAAVRLSNNRKLKRDLDKLAAAEGWAHRYVFFYCPGLPVGKHPKYEQPGIECHCVDIGP